MIGKDDEISHEENYLQRTHRGVTRDKGYNQKMAVESR